MSWSTLLDELGVPLYDLGNPWNPPLGQCSLALWRCEKKLRPKQGEKSVTQATRVVGRCPTHFLDLDGDNP